MTKRYIDTKWWDSEWFLELDGLTKLLWFYLNGCSDHAGIMPVAKSLADFRMKGVKCKCGETITLDWDAAMKALGDRLEKRNPAYWFVPSFMQLQYGNKLNTGDAVHGALRIVNELGFRESLERVLGGSLEGLETPIATAKAIAKAVREEKRVLGGGGGKFTPPSAQEVTAYALSIGFKEPNLGEKFVNHYESVNWYIGKRRMTKWKSAVQTWKLKHEEEQGNGNDGHKGITGLAVPKGWA